MGRTTPLPTRGRQGGTPINVDTDQIDRAAVSLCEFQISQRLGHIFRAQQTSDFGVDAHAELKHDGVPTGRLVGLQVKGGSSRFEEETDTGWKFRPKAKHIPYWLDHSLPMYLLLVDTTAQAIYWQELSERTLETGPRGGVYVVVPNTHMLESAGAAWEIAAEKFARTAVSDYSDNLAHLPPSTVRALAPLTNTDAAALLAAHLARGRGAPEIVVRTLKDSDPAWLSPDGKSDGLVALADYAHAHGLIGLAADVLLVAAERASESKYRYTRNAGLIVLESDRPRARELLATAGTMPEASGDLRIEIGHAWLAHPEGSGAPVPLPDILSTRLDAISNSDDDFVLSFLAYRSERTRNIDRAVDLFERALALTPDSAGHMENLARTLSRRARTPGMHPTDDQRAIQLASEAVDRLHSWSGPTESALPTLLRCLLLAGQFKKLLDRSLPTPEGRAANEESQRPDVRTFAARAATALDRRDLASQLVDSLPPGLDQDLARLQLKKACNEIEDEPTVWADLAERLDASRPEALVQVVVHLSDLGIDESARLDVLVDNNLITPDFRDLAAINALARVDLDAALPQLRLLADRDEIAAEKLVECLSGAERFDDAAAASEAAYLRFGQLDFTLQRATLLLRMGRESEAHDVVTNALAMSPIDPLQRRGGHRLLARLLLRRAANTPTDVQIWRQIKDHLTQCVNSEELPAEDKDVWELARAHMRLGEEADAFATIARHEPAIATPREAHLWMSVMLTQPTQTARTSARMLELADVFADEAQLSGALLTSVITRTRNAEDEPATPADQRTILDGDLRAAAFSALQSHVERHGDQSPIQILQGPTDEDLIDQIIELARRDEHPLVELTEMVRQARLPLGMLALAAGKPYSSTLAIRPLGYFITAATLEDDDLADEAAANTSSNRDVVVDVSALLIASELGEFDNFRGNFRNLLIPSASHADVREGRTILDGQSSSAGSIRYDAEIDSIVATETNIEDHLSTLARFSEINRALAPTLMVADASLDELELPGSEPWLGPIALAKQRGVPLWSDDLAQRRLARTLGVQAFGTTTLQQLRTADRLRHAGPDDTQYQDVLEDRRREVLDALRARIVDVSTDCQVVIDQGSIEEWSESVALITIGRPGWWHMAASPFNDICSILTAVEDGDGPSDVWLYHAMWGAARATPEDPRHAALLLACAALVCTHDTLDEDKTVKYLTAANDIAANRGVRVPSDFLIEAATALDLAGVCSYAPADVARLRARLPGSSDCAAAGPYEHDRS